MEAARLEGKHVHERILLSEYGIQYAESGITGPWCCKLCLKGGTSRRICDKRCIRETTTRKDRAKGWLRWPKDLKEKMLQLRGISQEHRRPPEQDQERPVPL